MAAYVSKIPRFTALACVLALAVGLSACGDDDEDNGSSGGGGSTAAQTTEGGAGDSGGTAGGTATSLRATAEESGGLSFAPRELSARAGSVTVTLDNPSGNNLPHAIEIEGGGVEEESDTIDPGARASVTVDLRPGRYTFYCPVDGHREQGMVGTLTVQ